MVEGIYFCGDQFFRFCKQRIFLDCLVRGATAGDADEISSWLTCETDLAGVVRGTYAMEGKRISFKTPGHFGDGARTIDYSGVRTDSGLILDWIDHNTGKQMVGVVYKQLARVSGGHRSHR